MARFARAYDGEAEVCEERTDKVGGGTRTRMAGRLQG